MTAPEHAATVRSDSFYADLKRGVAYAVARRAKLLAYLAAAAAFLITNGYVHGQAEAIANAVIAVVGFLAVHRVPNADPVADGPKPTEREADRALPGDDQ